MPSSWFIFVSYHNDARSNKHQIPLQRVGLLCSCNFPGETGEVGGSVCYTRHAMEVKVREEKNDAHTMERYNDPADCNWIVCRNVGTTSKIQGR